MALVCPQCGVAVKLRSFRPPPSKCQECGAWLDPREATERTTSRAFFPVVVMVSIGMAYLAFRLGEVLGPVFQMPGLGFRLAFLVGADSLGLGSLLYWQTVGGPNAKTMLKSPYIFALFAAVGAKCGGGLGPVWLVVWAIANGIVGVIVTLPLVRKGELPTMDTPEHSGSRFP